MAGAFAQRTTDTGQDGAGTTRSSGVFAGATGAASGLVAVSTYYNAGSQLTCLVERGAAGSGINFASKVAAWDSGSGYGIDLSVLENAGASTNGATVTYSASAGGVRSCTVFEFTGVATSGLVGASEYGAAFRPNVGVGTDAFTSPTFTVGQWPFILFGVAVNMQAGGAPSLGTGFTIAGATVMNFGYGGAGWEKAEYKRILSDPGAPIAATFARFSSADYGVIVGVALREPATAGQPAQAQELAVGSEAGRDELCLFRKSVDFGQRAMRRWKRQHNSGLLVPAWA